MIEAAPADWQCAIATALFTGLRLGELLALTREDVDLPGRRLNVRATLTEVNARTPVFAARSPRAGPATGRSRSSRPSPSGSRRIWTPSARQMRVRCSPAGTGWCGSSPRRATTSSAPPATRTAWRTWWRPPSPTWSCSDLRMPPTFTDEGATAARSLKTDRPELGVLLLSQHVDKSSLVDLVAKPGFGYLLKDRVFEVDEFLDAAQRWPAAGLPWTPKSCPRWWPPRRTVRSRDCPPVNSTCSG